MDRLSTRAGVLFFLVPVTVPPEAQVTPAAMSANVPPPEPSTRTGWMRALGATPVIPVRSVAAATMPATCVPCHELDAPEVRSPSSVGSGSRPLPSRAAARLEIMSYPATSRPSRSGCAVMPVSSTATTTPLPRVRGHSVRARVE